MDNLNIADLYSLFLKSGVTDILLIKHTKNQPQIEGMIRKKDLIRFYNNPLDTSQKVKFSGILKQLIQPISLPDAVEKIERGGLSGSLNIISLQGKAASVVSVKKTEFLTEIKMIKDEIHSEMNRLVMGYALPIMIYNRKLENIFQNEEAINIVSEFGKTSYQAIHKEILHKISEMIDKKSPLVNTTENFSIKTVGVNAQTLLQSLMVTNGMIYIATLIKIKKNNKN